MGSGAQDKQYPHTQGSSVASHENEQQGKIFFFMFIINLKCTYFNICEEVSVYYICLYNDNNS